MNAEKDKAGRKSGSRSTTAQYGTRLRAAVALRVHETAGASKSAAILTAIKVVQRVTVDGNIVELANDARATAAVRRAFYRLEKDTSPQRASLASPGIVLLAISKLDGVTSDSAERLRAAKKSAAARIQRAGDEIEAGRKNDLLTQDEIEHARKRRLIKE